MRGLDGTGSLTLNLTAFPRGAKTSQACGLQLGDPADLPSFNLFKQTRVKGWWPFQAKDESGALQLTVPLRPPLEGAEGSKVWL